jgi:hypothetical protein
VLTLKETPDGNVFEVSGDVALFVGDKEDVMVTNSLERIAQHYTLPAIPLACIFLNPKQRLEITE